MAANKAVWFREAGKPYETGDAETPVPEPSEILVRNHAIAINPIDWKVQYFTAFIQRWPIVLGCDIAGEVVAVGSDVTRFKKGDRIIGHATSLVTGKWEHGAFAHYTTLLEGPVAQLPATIPYTSGAVLPLAIDTAAIGLFSPTSENFLGLPFPSLTPSPSNKTIIVWGGSSSVGATAIQLATAAGVKTIAVASARNHEFVRGLGAAAAVDYTASTVVDDVVAALKSVGGEFVGLYDAIAEESSFKYVLPVLEKLGGGRLVGVLPLPEKLPEGVTGGQIQGFGPLTWPIWKEFVTPALEKGLLKCAPAAKVVGKGLEAVETGLGLSQKGVSATKLVVEL